MQYLIALNGAAATFECSAGHRFTHDYSKGPVTQRVPEFFLKRMAKYWGLKDEQGNRRGHVYGWCQKCQNIADGVSVIRQRQEQRR